MIKNNLDKATKHAICTISIVNSNNESSLPSNAAVDLLQNYKYAWSKSCIKTDGAHLFTSSQRKTFEENHGRLPPIHSQPTKSSKLRAVVEKNVSNLFTRKYKSIFPVFIEKNEDVSWTKSFVENVVLFQMSENAFYMTLE